MKILLIGEFSGFHINLKAGLESLGYECDLASDGDYWKKIDGSDICIYKRYRSNSIWNRFKGKTLYPLHIRKKLKNYDVVQFIDPKVFNMYVNQLMFDYIRKHNKKVFVSVPGHCFSVYDAYKNGKIGYYIFDDNAELCSIYEDGGVFSKARIRRKQERHIYSKVDGIIPIMYEYAVGVRGINNCKPTIPLPFDSSTVKYMPNVVGEKIVIMHGIIREKDKGSKYILEALDVIRDKYKDEVEIIVDGRMPLNDYMKLLSRVNILVDQCKEHCYGMNALYAMAAGRIVLGGASRKSLQEFGLNSCPVIHIKPDVNQIVSQLENLIARKNEYERLGRESREFVEQFHDCKRIAQMYIDTWNA